MTTNSVPNGPDDQMRIIDEHRIKCENTDTSSQKDHWCSLAWDGIMCWPPSPPGEVAQPCPSYIAGFERLKNATRICLDDGTWFVDGLRNHTWTNYTLCSDRGMATIVVPLPEPGNSTMFESALPVMKTMSQAGYSLSLISLIIASIALAAFKKLRCPRNKLHLHLFASFILRAAFSLLKDSLFVNNIGMSSDFFQKDGENFFYEGHENWACKLITSLWQYFIMANYSWILMEGLYLHNLIFLALFSDTSAITIYVALGWGLPSIFVGAWVFARVWLDNTLCWTTNRENSIFLIIRIPTAASILLNFVLFINIIRMLMKKLKASICDETRRHRYRRWAKSTLVLVPLFGVHYAVFLCMSYSSHTGAASSDSEVLETVWLFLDQAFASFQGFFVAILYCFLNGEVRAEITKAWRSRGPMWTHRRRCMLCCKCRPNRHPSLHSYDTCSSYGPHHASAPWSIRKKSEGRNTLTSTVANSEHTTITKPEEVPLNVCPKTAVARAHVSEGPQGWADNGPPAFEPSLMTTAGEQQVKWTST